MEFVTMETQGHKLKVWPEYFEALMDGTKTAEFRKEDDRTFRVGHMLHLREWNPETETYTGREAAAKVTHIVRGPLVPDGYAMLSLGRIAVWWAAEAKLAEVDEVRDGAVVDLSECRAKLAAAEAREAELRKALVDIRQAIHHPLMASGLEPEARAAITDTIDAALRRQP